ncbi:MAG: PhoH family protein [Nitrospirae bacterium]|nr:PhoH family protein [Nitrospirota bacterium]
MKKIYILDTNVLIHDPKSLFNFADNHVYLPIGVIEELDNFKKGADEKARNAREVVRQLDHLREKGPLSEGVALETGGLIRVEVDSHADGKELPQALDKLKNDNRILASALVTKADQDWRPEAVRMPVIIVSKDANLRIKADAMGITAEDYKTGKIEQQSIASEEKSITVADNDIDALYREKKLPLENPDGLEPNEFVIVHGESSDKHSGVAMFRKSDSTLRLLVSKKERFSGLGARNKEQQYALSLLMDDSIQLVTLVGKAGTGKTLLALAAGLAKVKEEKYSRLVVSRPIFPLGRDVGFLPGDVEAKIRPWLQPIFDNLEYLLSTGSGIRGMKSPKDLMNTGMLELEPLTYIRGRNLANQYFIVDEAQNLTPHEVKTIITRVGEGTKIVLTGDPYQIDNPYIDSESNGLIYVAKKFKGQETFGLATLVKGERSALAELASVIL